MGRPATTETATRVHVLAEDLIWASRLRSAIERAGAQPVMLRSPGRMTSGDAGERAVHLVVDLTARAYDGLAAVAEAARSGAHVICVAQHDDLELRRSALAAGASRVYSYNKLFSDGPAVIAAWLERAE